MKKIVTVTLALCLSGFISPFLISQTPPDDPEVISCETCLTVKTSSAYNSNTCIQLGTSHESGDIIP